LTIKPVKIGKKILGERHRCYIIAEIGSNFDGSFSKAKKLIKSAKECGADAAKFQAFKTELLLSKRGFEKKSAFQSSWKNSVWKTYKDAELPRDWHEKLNDYAKKIKIDFFTSPWDFEAVDILTKLKTPAIKIGSGDITYLDILKYIGSKQKPVLLATGASTLKEVEGAVRAIRSTGNNKIILMHSVTQYPSPMEEANLNALNVLKKKFSLNVGYSDHSPGSLIVLASIAMGASVIEKHFSLNPNSKGPDHQHSMSPKAFKKMVDDIRKLERAKGDGIKKIEKSEKETVIIQRRGIWTIKPIQKGEKFSKINIMALRPFNGTSASKFEIILGKKSNKSIRAFQSIKKSDF